MSGPDDVGPYRKNNEDAFLALALDAEGVYRLGKFGEAPLRNQDYIFAVSDGMGGANAGDFASRIAVEKITRLFPQVSAARPLSSTLVARTCWASCLRRSTVN